MTSDEPTYLGEEGESVEEVLGPDSLRELRRNAARMSAEALREALDAHADAWEADIDAKNKLIIGVNAVVADNAALRKRIEQKQSEIDSMCIHAAKLEAIVVAAQALMVEWTMEEDGVPTTETHAEDALADAVAALPSVNWASKGPCWAGGNIAGD